MRVKNEIWREYNIDLRNKENIRPGHDLIFIGPDNINLEVATCRCRVGKWASLRNLTLFFVELNLIKLFFLVIQQFQKASLEHAIQSGLDNKKLH